MTLQNTMQPAGCLVTHLMHGQPDRTYGVRRQGTCGESPIDISDNSSGTLIEDLQKASDISRELASWATTAAGRNRPNQRRSSRGTVGRLLIKSRGEHRAEYVPVDHRTLAGAVRRQTDSGACKRKRSFETLQLGNEMQSTQSRCSG